MVKPDASPGNPVRGSRCHTSSGTTGAILASAAADLVAALDGRVHVQTAPPTTAVCSRSSTNVPPTNAHANLQQAKRAFGNFSRLSEPGDQRPCRSAAGHFVEPARGWRIGHRSRRNRALLIKCCQSHDTTSGHRSRAAVGRFAPTGKITGRAASTTNGRRAARPRGRRSRTR